ncbi:MAG: ATP-binding cassette domain-containing protein [Candidatus Poribacteria bacterium]|nr:ATP-binding cassette domain-containing protein [Candidatus Poribacteria bacterium]
MEPIIEVKELSKEFKIYHHRRGFLGTFVNLFSRQHTVVRAVDHISFSMRRGEIVGYIGPNGAGKSTTIKMLTGILVPTSGHLTVNGYVPHRERKENARRIGVVFGQRTHLWFDLPVQESFELLRHIYQIPMKQYRENLELFDSIFELKGFFKTPVRQLSLGQRMRADIAAALLHNPDVLFLDEPTIGLDVVAKERLRQFIRQINVERQVTIILTTHDLDDVERLCERIILIDNARILFDGPLAAIRNLLSSERLLIVDYAEEYADVDMRDAVIVHREKGRVHYRFSLDEISAADLIGEILSRFKIVDLSVQEPEIEEVVRAIYENKVSIEQPVDGPLRSV